MTRDISPFGLRMPPELKNALEKEARINGRSMNSELVNRLQLSVERQRTGLAKSYKAADPTEAAAPVYLAKDDHERALLAVFRRMSPEKQLALLSLFK